MANQPLFRIDAEERLLFGNALNEVLHGFDVPEFERTIGADRETVERLFRHLNTVHQKDELTIGLAEARAIRNALRETIRELGMQEFHARTGYDYEQGQLIFSKLNSLLG